MIDPQRQQIAGLLIAVRHARRAFARSGRPRVFWDSFARGIMSDFRSGVPISQLTRTARVWRDLLETRPEPRGLTYSPQQIANRADASAQKGD